MAKKKSKIQTDDQGQFLWETYLVGGKQKRRKVRVIAGERVDDMDEFLLRNADDIDELEEAIDYLAGADPCFSDEPTFIFLDLTTGKAIPKDVDLLVEARDEAPLNQLARVRRQLAGRTMQTGDCCGVDVFLCNPQGEYLGRICRWKNCAPGVRQSCPAQHCGRRQFVCDDLQSVMLDRNLLAEPPLDLWPKRIERTDLPEDVRRELIEPLR